MIPRLVLTPDLLRFFQKKNQKNVNFQKNQRFLNFFSKILKTSFLKEIIILFNLQELVNTVIQSLEFTKFSSKQKESGQIPVVKISKKGDFENTISILVLNQCPNSAVFPIVRFAGDQKTDLSVVFCYYNCVDLQ